MSTNMTTLEEENDQRCKNRFETTPDSVPAVGHQDQTAQVDYPPPPPPPPPPPLVPVITNVLSKTSGKTQLGRRRMQKELQFELVQAIEREDLSAVYELIHEGTELNCIIMFNKTPLTYAIEKENFSMAKALVKGGADADFREPYANAQRPLHTAVSVCSYDMVEFLLHDGADVNGRNGCGLTPLMLACYCGLLQAVQLLHAHGADLSAQDNVGKTALHWAAEGQHNSVVQFLLAEGVDINAVDKFSRTVLYHSIMFRHVDMIRLLLKSGISVNTSDLFRQTPLQVTMHRSSRMNIQAVVSSSLDYHIRQKRIPTAEVRLLLNHRENEETVEVDFEILQLLVNAGAVVEFTRLDNHLRSLSLQGHDDLKIAIWHYLVLCDCTCGPDYISMMRSKVSLSVLEEWTKEKRSLQQLCRTAIRSHLSRMQPCDIHSLVNKLPIPYPLKNFLNLVDFFRSYPQFLRLSFADD